MSNRSVWSYAFAVVAWVFFVGVSVGHGRYVEAFLGCIIVVLLHRVASLEHDRKKNERAYKGEQ